jgi:hypothetical protein
VSLCRFSSDDFGCDLYIYHDGDRYVMHVAGNRVVGDIPKLAPFLESDSATWIESHNRQMAFLDDAKRERIGLPYAGECLSIEDPSEMEAKVLELRALGYRFPDYVLDELREDQRP